ncbi:hypothetical protein [Methylobacterium sp. J-090]|uniref:hypothetical protein n=1 Tax=Methylobacterium sp. J-090 TaxID=2836666 RepID=UPI001FB905D9|nr:hypothetical protein [Methylobacterium sp. J-090]MCJ2082443.1 hypothetical protein [Methylobacterium sp. J-090]
MTITPFAAGSYNTTLNTQRLLATKDKLDGLTTQLSTGRVAETYGGLGASRTTSLNAHAQVARLDGYGASITGALNRITLGSASLQNLSKVTSTTVSTIATGLTNTSSSAARDTTRQTAVANLDLFVDTLNQNYAGTYLFGGRATDTAPVASAGAILNGAGGKSGLTALIAERKTADGTAGTGNLDIPATTTATVTIAEGGSAAARANFGFTLQGIDSSNEAAISENPVAAVAPKAALSFGTQPKDGDVVRLSVNQTDGTQSFVDYTARTGPQIGPNEFLIGPDSGANLELALGRSQMTAPASLAAQPADGASVPVTIVQPDGTETVVTYTARTVATGAANEFEIGQDTAGSLGNLTKAVGTRGIAAAQSQSPPGVTVALSGGNPASNDLTVSAVTPPKDGDTVTVTLGLRDGTTTTLTLTAKTVADSKDPSVFAIGASPEATAANLQKALSDTVKTSAGTTLAGSSAVLASKDFFAGSKSAAFAPRRVDTATGGFSTNPSGKTVIWYTGDESLADPRGTATVQVSSGQSIGIGAQANEAGIRNALSGIAALASESFASTKDPNDTTLSAADRASAVNERSRYTALTDRVRNVLTPKQDDQGIASVATELSLAAAQITNAKAQNGATRAQLQNTLDGTDSISTEEVAAKLLAVQNQLQASYQVTSMLSKLTLVNYMS